MKELKYLKKKDGADRCTATKLVHKIIERLTWELQFFGSTLQKIFLGHFSPGWITPKDRDSSSAKHEVAWDVTRKNIVKERKALSSVDFYEWPKDKKRKRKKKSTENVFISIQGIRWWRRSRKTHHERSSSRDDTQRAHLVGGGDTDPAHNSYYNN